MAAAIRGDGAGGLGTVATGALSGVPSDLALGDLDGLGYVDLVLVAPGTSSLLSLLATGSGPPVSRFVRGDSSGDGAVDLADAVSALFHLFLGGASDCLDSLDTNDDGAVDLADPISLLDFLFRRGPPPPPPFPAAGKDPGAESLGCDRP